MRVYLAVATITDSELNAASFAPTKHLLTSYCLLCFYCYCYCLTGLVLARQQRKVPCASLPPTAYCRTPPCC
jgi:hypothetical protein